MPGSTAAKTGRQHGRTWLTDPWDPADQIPWVIHCWLRFSEPGAAQACGQRGPAVRTYLSWTRTVLPGSPRGAGSRRQEEGGLFGLQAPMRGNGRSGAESYPAAARGKGKAGPAAPVPSPIAAAGHQGLRHRPGCASNATAAAVTGGNTQWFVSKCESRPRTDILHYVKPIHEGFCFVFFF